MLYVIFDHLSPVKCLVCFVQNLSKPSWKSLKYTLNQTCNIFKLCNHSNQKMYPTDIKFHDIDDLRFDYYHFGRYVSDLNPHFSRLEFSVNIESFYNRVLHIFSSAFFLLRFFFLLRMRRVVISMSIHTFTTSNAKVHDQSLALPHHLS